MDFEVARVAGTCIEIQERREQYWRQPETAYKYPSNARLIPELHYALGKDHRFQQRFWQERQNLEFEACQVRGDLVNILDFPSKPHKGHSLRPNTVP